MLSVSFFSKRLFITDTGKFGNPFIISDFRLHCTVFTAYGDLGWLIVREQARVAATVPFLIESGCDSGVAYTP